MKGYKIVRLLSENVWGKDNAISRGGDRCPAIWEVENGDFIVVGEDLTNNLKKELPTDFILGDNEKIIRVPRNVLQSAKKNIP